MEGADNAASIDFLEGGVAVPVPEAAWSLGKPGAVLLVLRMQTYEGTAIRAVIVNSERGRSVEAMDTYLYSCAF